MKRPVIGLVGQPNSGKTSLFNALTGARQKVGNYPGITVERTHGQIQHQDTTLELIDLPGTYSLVPRGADEEVVLRALTQKTEGAIDVIAVVLDGASPRKGLYLALSALELGRPTLLILNMADAAKRRGIALHAQSLSDVLGIPIHITSCRTGEGINELPEQLARLCAQGKEAADQKWTGARLRESLSTEVQTLLHEKPAAERAAFAHTLCAAEYRLLNESEGGEPVPPELSAPIRDLRSRGVSPQSEVAAARYAFVDQSCLPALYGEARPEPEISASDKADRWLLHPVLGPGIFLLVMSLLFQAIFYWSEPFMDTIEAGVGWGQSLIHQVLAAGPLRDLLADGIVGGVGNVIIFVPQIAFLFFLIALLEDSGYLARAALITDRLMSHAGLHGKAFVPLLSGFACAVPAIMSARTLENEKDRLVTILVTPFISCSARLPVYALILASLFSSFPPLFGIFSVAGLLLLAMYLLSVTVTVTAAFILKKTVLRSPKPTLVLELPPYRRPIFGDVVRRVGRRCGIFLKDAGTIILVCSIVLWALLYYPRSDQASHREATSAAVAHQLEHSYGGRIGKAIEPVVEPLGFDWKIGIALVASFAAREVVVSTLGLLYELGEVDEEDTGLREAIRAQVDPKTGKKVFTPAVGLSLMVFFLLACQCMSTVAVVKRETQSWKWPVFMVANMTAIAWIGSLITFQLAKLFGLHAA